MNHRYNKFLIVSSVVLLILGIYSYFYNDLIKEPVSADSSITSSLDPNNTTPIIIDDKVTQDTSFLLDLSSISSINIDTSLFSDLGFNLLVDNNIKLEPVPYGRDNPFSPINKSPLNTSLRTDFATLISSRSAVLNGALEGVTSNNIYFEYGPTPALGKLTSKITPSLVGNFASNITGLNSTTTYYYRAAANIKGSITFGEIMSFITN